MGPARTAALVAGVFFLSAVCWADPKYPTPKWERVSTIAHDVTGHLRDPSSAILVNGTWLFVVCYIPLSQHTTGGWNAYLHWYSAPAPTGPWTGHGLLFNHSSDPTAFDARGTFSPGLVWAEDEQLFYVFYSGVGTNYTDTLTNAQLVASAPAMEGPWTRHGLVAWPTGSPPSWNTTWNARRCDSGRAMTINGRKGYWTKGVKDWFYAQEGAYFPTTPGSFKPPYIEYEHNPIFPANRSKDTASAGYENCEFFLGPGPTTTSAKDANSNTNTNVSTKANAGEVLHVVCKDHAKGSPHFVSDATGLIWTHIGVIDTGEAGEPTPVYQGPMPGDTAKVTQFIARTETPNTTLHIDLYNLVWK